MEANRVGDRVSWCGADYACELESTGWLSFFRIRRRYQQWSTSDRLLGPCSPDAAIPSQLRNLDRARLARKALNRVHSTRFISGCYRGDYLHLIRSSQRRSSQRWPPPGTTG